MPLLVRCSNLAAVLKNRQHPINATNVGNVRRRFHLRNLLMVLANEDAVSKENHLLNLVW